MIWGKTLEQEQAWRPWFAWHPVVLDDGRIAWLERLEIRTQYGIYGVWREHRLPQ